jgi:AcrR family transcriptional regulator
VLATLSLLEEYGYAGLTMAGVAERAGVSTATLYRRCSSKEELVVGALATLVPEGPPRDTGSLEGDLRQMLGRMTESVTGERGRLLLGLAGEMIRHPALAEPVRVQLREPMREHLAAILERAVQRGEIPVPADRDLAIALMVGPLHYWLLSGDQVSPAVVEMLVPMVRRALGAGYE